MIPKKHIVIILIVAIFGIGGLLGVTEYHEYDIMKKMDIEEKHYDASGFLVLINTDDELVGIYSGSYPLAHFKQHVEWNEKYHLTTIRKLKIVHNINLDDAILKYIQVLAIPMDTPVIVYKNKKGS